MKYIEVKICTGRRWVEMITAALDSIGIDSLAVNDPADLQDILDNKEAYKYDYIDDALLSQQEGSGDAGEDDALLLQQEAEISLFLTDDEAGREKLKEVTALAEKMKQEIARQEKTRSEKDPAGEAGGRQKEGNSDEELLRVEKRIVDDGDWKDKWKEFFKPSRITDRITVKPTWEEYEPEPCETVIEIDPGMAFGTGTHETTSSCIMLMEKYLASENAGVKDPLSGFTVLDVGCGSGILAIAAAFLGCGSVTGVDLDPDAVEAARENVKINHVEDKVRILEGDLAEGIDIKADMVAANLTVNLIERLLSDIKRHIKDGGIFIASGILSEQETRAKDAMKAQGLEVLETASKGDWCTIAAVKR